MSNPYSETAALNSSRALAGHSNSRTFDLRASAGKSPFYDINRAHDDNERRTAKHQGESDENHDNDKGSRAKEVLFEENVMVHVKAFDREEVRQPLGVCVIHGKETLSKSSTIVSGNSRAITVRLTDPRDPFFLYSMLLCEDEYGKFKEINELHVDFNGFPQDLISMLRFGDAYEADGTSLTNNVSVNATGHLISFVTDGNTGTLRILEKTGFRDLEHIRLVFNRQGDVAQKMYLADRFKHFESLCSRQQQQWRAETACLSKNVKELEQELHCCRAECEDIRHRMALETSEITASAASETTQRQERHATELSRLRSLHESERSKWETKYESDVKELKTDLATSKQMVQDLDSRGRDLHDKNQELERQVLSLSKKNESLQNEVAQAEEREKNALAFKVEATRFQTNATLEAAKMAERLKHLQESLKAREDELFSVRKLLEQQGAYGVTLKEQLETARKHSDSQDVSLAKAHHIISNQLQSIRMGKERLVAVQKELAQAQDLGRERLMALEREKNDRQSVNDRLEVQQQRCSALQEQLAQAEEQRAQLTTQLKQNEEALIHMGKVSYGDFRNRAALQSPQSGHIYTSFATGLHTALPSKQSTLPSTVKPDVLHTGAKAAIITSIPSDRTEASDTSAPPVPHIANQKQGSSAYFPKRI